VDSVLVSALNLCAFSLTPLHRSTLQGSPSPTFPGKVYPEDDLRHEAFLSLSIFPPLGAVDLPSRSFFDSLRFSPPPLVFVTLFLDVSGLMTLPILLLNVFLSDISLSSPSAEQRLRSEIPPSSSDFVSFFVSPLRGNVVSWLLFDPMSKDRSYSRQRHFPPTILPPSCCLLRCLFFCCFLRSLALSLYPPSLLCPQRNRGFFLFLFFLLLRQIGPTCSLTLLFFP